MILEGYCVWNTKAIHKMECKVKGRQEEKTIFAFEVQCSRHLRIRCTGITRGLLMVN